MAGKKKKTEEKEKDVKDKIRHSVASANLKALADKAIVKKKLEKAQEKARKSKSKEKRPSVVVPQRIEVQKTNKSPKEHLLPGVIANPRHSTAIIDHKIADVSKPQNADLLLPRRDPDQLIRGSLKPPKDEEEEKNLPPSHRYFGVPIKGHPDYEKDKKLAEGLLKVEGSENDLLQQLQNEQTVVTWSQVVLENGRVVGVEVDKEIVEELEKERIRTDQLCQCCREEIFVVSSKLELDPKTRGRFLFNVLMLENVLHLLPLFWMLLQYLVQPLHDFLYNQWALSLLFIVVMYITVIWSVVFSDLGRHHPADNVLLVTKMIALAHVSATVTAALEHGIVFWRLQDEDFEESTSLPRLYEARASERWKYTYPIIVPVFLIYLTIVYTVLALYFLILKGDVARDTMFWLALGVQLFLLILGGVLISVNKICKPIMDKKYPGKNNPPCLPFFDGPMDWDVIQVEITGVLSATWILWRLFNFRRLLEGRKYDINEREFKVVALGFAM